MTSIVYVFSLSQASVKKRDCVLINADYVSGFKNKEMDIAIVSCTKRIYNVLEPVADEWLYTAITRVKHSLILYGSFKKLKVSIRIIIYHYYKD